MDRRRANDLCDSAYFMLVACQLPYAKVAHRLGLDEEALTEILRSRYDEDSPVPTPTGEGT